LAFHCGMTSINFSFLRGISTIPMGQLWEYILLMGKAKTLDTIMCS